MIIDCIGCLHGYRPQLEGGDLLIVTGDLTARHTPFETVVFLQWLSELDYKKIIFIAGNHDTQLIGTDDSPVFFVGKIFDLEWPEKIVYLCDSGTEFEGKKIWGSPWSLWFKGINPKCNAFTGSESDLEKHYKKIPDDVDILITHQPPFGILDGIPIEDGSLYHVGSHVLRNQLKTRIRPFIHVFSHIHEAYGKEVRMIMREGERNFMESVNCSIMNEKYQPINKPIRA